MIKLNVENWSESEGINSLLLFAQLFEEMLNHYTIDSFRAPLLNTHTLFDEFVDVNNEVKVGYLKPHALIPIKEELLDSLSNDNVAKKVLFHHLDYVNNSFTNFKINIQEECDTKRNDAEFNNIVIAKQILDKSYFEQLKEDLADLIIDHPDEKEKITELTRLFVTELLYIGYSEEHLYHINQNFFFKKQQITTPNQIKDFLSIFSKDRKHWTVIFRGTGDFESIRDTQIFREFNIKIKKNSSQIGNKRKTIQEKTFLSTKNKEFPLFLICSEVPGMDPYAAKIVAERYIRFINTLTNHNNHNLLLGIEKPILFNQVMIKQKSFFSITKPTIEPLAKIEDEPDNLEKDLDDLTNVFLKLNRDSASFHNLMYSMNSHHCALKTNTHDHQLLSLWTAIETLLPPPNKNESIIGNFVSSVYPFLSHEYVQKIFEDLRISIKNHLTEEEYQDFLSKFPDEFTDLEKIIMSVSFEEHDSLLQKLCKKFRKNSLLPNRIFQLTKKFRRSKDIMNTLKIHDKRIQWQLKRIYRVRNLITHKGKPTDYVPRLLENTHFYYHTIIKLIIKKYQNEDHSKCTLAHTFALIKFEYESHLKYLEQNKELDCNQENFKKLLFCNI